MRILHTADWHLGARLVERDRLPEHAAFLDWLLETLRSEKIDALLVSGDVFDAANPPQDAVALYFDFLKRLADLKTVRAVITGGNHDSASHLNAPRDLLRRFDVHVFGHAGANNLVSAEKFWNFELHCEFKIGAHSNGGLGLRGRYEIQIIDDYGKPAGSHGTGALYSRITPTKNASKAPGEWQTYDIRLVGMTVTVKVNGETVIDKGIVEGLTAMAHDWDESAPGPISVQGDHGPVEIRKLTITPLTK